MSSAPTSGGGGLVGRTSERENGHVSLQFHQRDPVGVGHALRRHARLAGGAAEWPHELVPEPVYMGRVRWAKGGSFNCLCPQVRTVQEVKAMEGTVGQTQGREKSSPRR